MICSFFLSHGICVLDYLMVLFLRYFSSQLDSGSADPAASNLPQLAKNNILGLIDMFILHIDRPPKKHRAPLSLTAAPGVSMTTPSSGHGGEYFPPLSAVEEMQLLLTIHSQLQDQKRLEMRFCIFDAVFSADEGMVCMCVCMYVLCTMNSL